MAPLAPHEQRRLQDNRLQRVDFAAADPLVPLRPRPEFFHRRLVRRPPRVLSASRQLTLACLSPLVSDVMAFFEGVDAGGGRSDLAEEIGQQGLRFVDDWWSWSDQQAYVRRLASAPRSLCATPEPLYADV
jgi:hypothetical protein